MKTTLWTFVSDVSASRFLSSSSKKEAKSKMIKRGGKRETVSDIFITSSSSSSSSSSSLKQTLRGEEVSERTRDEETQRLNMRNKSQERKTNQQNEIVTSL